MIEESSSGSIFFPDCWKNAKTQLSCYGTKWNFFQNLTSVFEQIVIINIGDDKMTYRTSMIDV